MIKSFSGNLSTCFSLLVTAFLLATAAPGHAQKPSTSKPATAAKPKGVIAPKIPEQPKALADKVRKLDPDDVPRADKVRSPREMLKTFYFAVSTYDLSPAMIRDALLCMDLEPAAGLKPAPDAVVLALDLELILRELELPLAGVPDQSDECEVVLYDMDGIRIGVKRCEEGWRFDRATLQRVPAMRRILQQQRKPAPDSKLFREGFASPRESMKQFLMDALNGDFYAAARALDLSALSNEQRLERGPILAQQLAFIMQRRGYTFFQEIPAQPSGMLYTWNADETGRIALERVRLADGKEAWLFSRKTAAKLPPLYDASLEVPPDPRILRLGIIIPPLPAQGTSVLKQKRYDNVPPHLGSPRAVLKGFFRAMDGAEANDARLTEALEFLDLRGIAATDRASLGPKIAGKLENFLRKVNLDLSAVSDDWNAPPFVAGDAQGYRIEVARQVDGCWRFTEETLTRVQTLFSQLAAKDRVDRERAHQLESPRDTVITFLDAVAADNFERAAGCLDLTWLHPAARDEVGPILAFKLKFALDRLGRLYIQEIPNEPDGARYLAYRGEHGRIVIARKTDDPGKGTWLFTAETVQQIEPIFRAMMRQPVDAALEGEKGVLDDADPWNAPGIWLRLRLPDWLQISTRFLEPYQWIGLALAALLSLLLAAFLMAGFNRGVGLLLRWSGSKLSLRFVASKLRPVTWLAALGFFFHFAYMLDLPLGLSNTVLPLKKFVQAVMVGWFGCRLIDLIMGIYTNSELLRPHRSLSDMVVPVTMRIFKTVLWLLILTYMVYQIGEGELVGRFLTGLGVLGLAASLAAQDALKSFFGTLLLIGERTFKIGDRILVNGQEGVVEQVGFRVTLLRTMEGSLMTIPNSTLASAAIDNQGQRTFRRIRSTILAHPDTSVDRLLQLRERLHTWLLHHPLVNKDKLGVYLHQITDKGIELAVNLTLTTGAKAEESKLRQDFHGEVLRQCAALNLALTGATVKPAARSDSFAQAA